MKGRAIGLLVATALGTTVSASAASAARGEPRGCLGAAVADAAHVTQEVLGVGLGTYLHDSGRNPGLVIRTYRVQRLRMRGGAAARREGPYQACWIPQSGHATEVVGAAGKTAPQRQA